MADRNFDSLVKQKKENINKITEDKIRENNIKCNTITFNLTKM